VSRTETKSIMLLNHLPRFIKQTFLNMYRARDVDLSTATTVTSLTSQTTASSAQTNDPSDHTLDLLSVNVAIDSSVIATNFAKCEHNSFIIVCVRD
jgi:hypothetical protein